MRTIALLCAAIAAAALTGCGGLHSMGTGSTAGSMKPPPDTHKCTLDDDCMVTVIVEPRDGDSCRISIKPDVPLEMKSNGQSGSVSHLIRWVLSDESQDAKFRFANDGIVLKASTPDPSGQFFKKARKSEGREFQWRDRNSDFNYYDYTINIIQKDSTRKCTWDPRIWNY